MTWREVLEELVVFRDYEEDWDTYGSGPISEQTFDAARKLVDVCSRSGASPVYVCLTCDDTVILKLEYRCGKIEILEIDGDGNMGVEIQPPDGESIFCSRNLYKK